MSYSLINWEDYPSENTPVTAQSLNHMDQQIKTNADNLEDLMEEKTYTLTGTLSAGSTSLVFTSSDFSSDSEIRFLTKPYGYFPISVTEDLDNNKITTTWRAATEDIDVKLKFTN